jgi:hypothetical protein
VNGDRIQRSRRALARDCPDWSERRPHLAGALPAALLDRFLELGWLTPRPNDRGLLVTPSGKHGLTHLGHELTHHDREAACVS